MGTTNLRFIPVKALFKDSFSLFQEKWKNLVLVSLVIVAVGVVWKIAASTILLISGIGSLFVGISTGSLTNVFTVGALGIVVFLLTWIVSFELVFLSDAALIVVLKQIDINVSLSTVYKEAKKFVVPLSIASLLAFLFVFMGLIFLIIPGLILIFLFQFVNFAVILENKKGTEALKRSATLVWGNLGVVFVRVFVLSIAVVLINLVFRRMLFFNLFSNTLIAPFAVVYHYLLYKNLVAT